MWRSWIENAKPVAFGPLLLTHVAFWRLTPREFEELYDGWKWRDEHQEERQARWVAHLMNATGNFKQEVTVAKLLGRLTGPIRDNPEREKK